jgi:ATP-dependent RNA helicase HelY
VRRQSEVREAFSRLRPGDVFVARQRGGTRTVAVVKKSQGRRAESGILVVDADGRYRRLHERSLSHPPDVAGSVSVDKITSPTRKVRRSVGAKMESLTKGARVEVAKTMSAEEKAIAREAALAREALEKDPCRDCQHRERCLEAARRVERIERQMGGARKERDSGHDVVSSRLVDVVDLLNEFGFMEGENVTPKGALLRRIYNECDLLLAEALSQGILSGLSPAELAALASWFIYESREGESEQERRAGAGAGYMEGPLGDALEELEIMEVEMKTAEEEMGLDLLGSLDTGFGEAAHLWAGGVELEEMLARFPDSSVGDMVRTMKQIIDLLRQLAEVSEDPVLDRNLRVAMDMLDRGIVGYSSLESIIEMDTRVAVDGEAGN